MIITIALTALITAGCVAGAMHRSNRQVYRLEQTALNRAGEIEVLTQELLSSHARIRNLNRALTKAVCEGNANVSELAALRSEARVQYATGLLAAVESGIAEAPTAGPFWGGCAVPHCAEPRVATTNLCQRHL